MGSLVASFSSWLVAKSELDRVRLPERQRAEIGLDFVSIHPLSWGPPGGSRRSLCSRTESPTSLARTAVPLGKVSAKVPRRRKVK